MAMKLRHTEIGLPAGDRWLDGILAHHPEVCGLIVLAERSGATLKTARGAFVANALGEANFSTLQVALLSHDEERKSPEVWRQVSGLVTRLAAVVEWIRHQPALKELPLGMVARDAAAAAMVRLASRGGVSLRALASRAGRPDRAGAEPLRELATPILLLVGQLDEDNLEPNRRVHDLLGCAKELAIVPAASQGFEELGALDSASRMVVDWFRRWMPARSA